MPATLPDSPLFVAGLRSRTARAATPMPASSSQPSAVHLWFQEAMQDAVAQAKNDFNSWLQQVGESETVFERYVYNNPNLSDLDLIQHRARLYRMLADGEDLNVTFWILGAKKKIDPSNYFKLIQENIENLLTKLNAWHGPLEAQEDIPEDFKEGIRDIAEGKIVDLDEAIAKTPSADAV